MDKAENQFRQVEMITVREVIKITNVKPIFTADSTLKRT
jgi:hypothetical protein